MTPTKYDPCKQLKWCSSCEGNLPYTDFTKVNTSASGLSDYCRECTKRRRAEWRKKNPQANEQRRGTRAEENKRGKLGRTRGRLRNKYGISLERYEEILRNQGGVCAVCFGVQERRDRELMCVDHDHVTGYVRGLLCDKCNMGLGLLKDDPVRIARLLEYLLKANAEQSEKVNFPTINLH